MIEYYKKPTVKFIVNKGNFNKLMEKLTVAIMLVLHM